MANDAGCGARARVRLRPLRMSVLGPLLTLIVCAYALWRGGPCERSAGWLVLAVQVVQLVVQMFARSSVWPVVWADLVMSAGMLALSVRYRAAWTLVAIALASGLLIVHSLLLEDGATTTPLYDGLVNGFNLALLATLVTAVVFSARRRRTAMAPA